MALPGGVTPVSDETITYNGVVFRPVTEWNTVRSAGSGGSYTYVGSSARILMGEDSLTTGTYADKFHLLAQFSIYSYGNTTAELTTYRKIGSAYDGTGATTTEYTQGSFYTSTSTALRKYNFLWGTAGLRDTDYPYCVEDLGAVDYSTTKTSKLFDVSVWPTGVSGGVHAQSTASYTTPDSGGGGDVTYNVVWINGKKVIDLSTDDVSADKVLDTVTKFHDKNGATISGGTIATIPSGSITFPTGASAGKVVVPSGYYASTYTIDIPAGTAATPTTSSTISNTQPSVTLSGSSIVMTVDNTVAVTPTVSAGYVTSGTAGNVRMSGTRTVALNSLDGDFTGANIRASVNLFGVSGTFTSDATAVAADVLLNKTVGIKGSMVSGTMPNNGAVAYTITTASQTVLVASGYHNGTTVEIASAEQAKLLPENIKASVTILGISGTYNPLSGVTTSAIVTNSFFASGSETYREFDPATYGVDYFSNLKVTPITVIESATGSGTTGTTIRVSDGATTI